MKTEKIFLLLVAIFLTVFACNGLQASGAGKIKAPIAEQMTITGEIAKSANDVYIIRGQKPAEIFTILNPAPEILEKLTTTGKIVVIEAGIVSGDNIEIKTIDGKKYSQEAQ